MKLIKKKEEIEKIREGGEILSYVLKELKKASRPGVDGKFLDDLAQKLIESKSAKPSFKGYQGYPASICLSLNEEIVHGIPFSRTIKEGDIVSLDVGVFFKNFHTDAAITFGVGKISAEAKKLIEITKEALEAGIMAAKNGNYVVDISRAIEEKIEKAGFFVVKSCTGHGIGRSLHEDPVIPNFVEYEKNTNRVKKGMKLQEGMILAIEPMALTREENVILDSDGWTIINKNGGLAAHFETTVLVGRNKGEVLVDIDID